MQLLIIMRNVNIPGTEFKSWYLSFLALYTHDFFNCFTNVESGDIFPKFPCFYLGIIKEVLHKVHHDLTRTFLHLLSFFQLLHNQCRLFLDCRVTLQWKNFLELFIQLCLLKILGDDWIQRIPHFMRKACVDEANKLVFCFLFVVHDTSRNIYDLEHSLSLAFLHKLGHFDLYKNMFVCWAWIWKVLRMSVNGKNLISDKQFALLIDLVETKLLIWKNYLGVSLFLFVFIWVLSK